MSGLVFVPTYLDDILVLTTDTWEDHLNKLDTVLARITHSGLKVNAGKKTRLNI
jgi:hypothetical protein